MTYTVTMKHSVGPRCRAAVIVLNQIEHLRIGPCHLTRGAFDMSGLLWPAGRFEWGRGQSITTTRFLLSQIRFNHPCDGNISTPLRP